jgi:hypothetical protein
LMVIVCSYDNSQTGDPAAMGWSRPANLIIFGGKRKFRLYGWQQ